MRQQQIWWCQHLVKGNLCFECKSNCLRKNIMSFTLPVKPVKPWTSFCPGVAVQRLQPLIHLCSRWKKMCLYKLVIYIQPSFFRSVFPLCFFILSPFFTILLMCHQPPYSSQLPPSHTHTHTLALAFPDVCWDDVMADWRHWTLIPFFFFFWSRKHSWQTREHEGEEWRVDKYPDNVVSFS